MRSVFTKWILAILTTFFALIISSLLVALLFGKSRVMLAIGLGISYSLGKLVYKHFDNKQEKEKSEKKEELPYLGGQGLSVNEPVYVNCTSVDIAQDLIDRFICDKHGEKDKDWEMVMSLALDSDKTKCGIINEIIIKSGVKEFKYYFDLSRAVIS